MLRPATDVKLPPHPLDKQWFAHVDGQQYGPFSGHDIKRMIEQERIKGTDHLCPVGGSQWLLAKEDPVLGALFVSAERKRLAETQKSSISGNTGTVVQVTNNIPNPVHAALLLDVGRAAPKSPGVALLLSFLLMGAGQMYNGEVGKGFLMLIGGIFLWLIFLGWIIWIWSMIDAYSTAKEMNLRYQRRMVAGMM
jgi:TM2 domain-containing membrane protein YozV